MKTKFPLFRLDRLLLALGLLAILGAAHEAKAQYQITTLGATVTENFNGMLVPTGAGTTNINFNSGLGDTSQAQRNSAWVLTSSNGQGNQTGSGTAGGWQAYGNNATTTDKALGALGNASLSSLNATATYVNASGSTVTSFVLSYTGEQWRANGGAGSITVQYSINGGTFTSLDSSTFNKNIVNATNISNTTNSAGALNGDAAGNRTTDLGATVTGITLLDGQNIQFRFLFTIGSNSKGVAIDDVAVTFNGDPAPPPGGGNYWAGAASGGGGAGTWTTAGTNWATGAGGAGRGAEQATSGVLIFTDAAGTVTVEGGVSVAAGMQFSTTGYTVQSSTITLSGANAAANTITTDSAVTTTISSALAGTTGATKAGTGKLVLSGDNSGLTGGVTLSAGTLALGSANAVGANALTLNGGTLTSADGTARTLNNTITFGGNVGLGETSTGNLNFSGTVSFGSAQRTLTIGSGVTTTLSGTYGTGGITKAGAGNLVFDSSGSITTLTIDAGGVTINAGDTLTTTAGALGTAAGTAFTINGTLLNTSTTTWAVQSGTITVGSTGRIIQQGNGTPTNLLFGSAGLTWETGSEFVFRNFSNAPSVSGRTFAMNLTFESTGSTVNVGAISGGGAWTVQGNLTIGENVNFNYSTYTGALSYQGNVVVGGTLGATTGARSFTITGGKELLLQNTGTLNMGTDQVLTVSGGVRSTATAAQVSTLSGGSVNLGGGTRTFEVAAGTGAAGMLVSSAITNGSLTKAGAGNLILSNTGTSFGTLTANAGQVSIAANAAVTGLSGASALNLQGGTLTLNASANSTFSGAISGSGNLTKAGNATLTLSGNSSHTGTITVTNGTLVANGTQRGSAISVGHASTAGGSVLMGSGSVGATTINNNGMISPGNSVGTLSVSNTLTWNSGGSYLWEINSTNGPAGTTWDLITVDTATVGAGTLALPGSGSFTINGFAIDAFSFDGNETYDGNYFLIVQAGTITGDLNNLSFVATGLGLGSWTFSTNATGLYLNYTAPTGEIVFNNAGLAFQGDADIATPSGPWGLIDEGYAVTMSGGGTLVMTNANNSYSGVTTVLNGTIRADVNSLNGADGAFGNAITAIVVGDTSGSANASLDVGVSGVEIGRAINVVAGSSGTKTLGSSLTSGTAAYSGNVVLDDSAALTSGGTANVTFSGNLSGAGGIDKVGAGTVTLSGANTYAGGTTVSAGTLVGNTGSLVGAILNNAALVFNQSANGTYANAISGTGSLVKTGAGTLTLSAGNTYGGGTTVSAGTLAGSTTSLQGNIENNAAVIFNQATNGTYAGDMSGTGTLALGGGVAITLSGNSSFSGGTSIDDATVRATADTALGDGNIALSADGSLLAGAGVTIDNAITVGLGELILYNQDFNAIGSGLPEDWSVRTGATSSTLGTSTTFGTAATSWGSSTGGFFNYASATGLASTASVAEQSASTDRALGLRQTGTGIDPGAAINFAFSTTGQTVDSLSFDLMMLDVQTRSTTWSLEYGIGSAPTTFTLLGTWADPGAFGITPLTFTTADFGTDLDNQSDIVFRLVALTASTGGGSRDTIAIDNFVISSGINAAGASGVIGSDITSGIATFSGAVTLNGSARLTAASGGTTAVTGVLSGAGGIIKTGAGLVTLSGSAANTFTGATTVTAGTLELNGTGGAAASTSAVSVLSGATLLISQIDQVNDSAAVTLSGGTIRTGAGVSEVFGNLIVTGSGFLDFGTTSYANANTISFGTYTPSALLTIDNFNFGSTLTFKSDLTGAIQGNSFATFNNGGIANYSWDNDSSTFTITAIPEPSTYAAAVGLLGLMLWPSRKRLLKDAKKILGFTPPMRDRLAARSKA